MSTTTINKTQEIRATLKANKNLDYDKKAGVFTVRRPSGKAKTYKVFKTAVDRAQGAVISIEIPYIVIANTYFWNPSCTASGRRSTEDRRQAEIDAFCAKLNRLPGFEISGSYTETCNHVYKFMTYRVNGVTTNLTGLIGAAKKWGINLVK